MARVKYDVTDVEPGQDFDTPIPKGVYLLRITECEDTVSNSSGNPMFAVTLEVAKGEFKGRLLWDYIVRTDEQAWKLRQFLEAVKLVGPNGSKSKGSLDTDDIVGTLVVAKVRHQGSPDDEYGVQAKIGSLKPVPDDEAEEEEEEAEEGTTEDLSYEDVMEMDLDDLKDIIDEDGLDIRVTKRSKVEAVRVKVCEALELEAEEEDEEEEDEEETEVTWEYIQEADRDELEEIAAEEEIKFTKRTSDDKLREKIAEALELEAEEEEEEEDEEEGYDSWDLGDLKAECKERGITYTGSKRALIKRLTADDAKSGSDPF